MNSKIAILATTSILTFGIAIPAFAQNDNAPAGSFRVAEGPAGKTMDSDPAMSGDDENMENQALEEDMETGDMDTGDDGAMGEAEMPGKTMESDPK